MGLRGPKPKPSAILSARGSRLMEHRKDEPKIEALHDVPVCPEWLQGFAREFWEDYAQRLVVSGILTEIDIPAFVGLCKQWQVWREAEAALKHLSDRLQTAKNGYQSVGALESLADKRWKLFLQSCAEFGMTPSARANVKAVPRKSGQVVTAAEKFFAKGK